MRCAAISDVHSNLEALEAVLGDIEKKEVTNVLFLGDAIGYGPNPNECLELLKRSCSVMLLGNHDAAVAGLTDVGYFNEYARLAVEWTASVIKPGHLEMVKSLPLTKVFEEERVFLVHATPKDPDEWRYLFTLWDAEVNFNYFPEDMCFLGHSHRPNLIEQLPSGEVVGHKNTMALTKTERYIINAGSVGQPRDGDSRACYAFIDDEKVELIRVQYDIEKTQKKMKDAGLPLPLIKRLEKGV